MNAVLHRILHRALHRPRRQTLSAGAILAVGVLLCCGQSLGWGAWIRSSATAGTGEVTAASLSTAGAPTPTQVLGAKTVGLTWTSVTNATSYEVRYYTSASGGTGTVVCAPTTTSCVDTTNRAGSNNWYSVRARAGTQWVGAESPRAGITADTTTVPPTITALGSDTGVSATDFVTNAGSNTLTGTSEANATLVIRRNGPQVATATANGSGVWTSTAFTLNEGTQDLVATATDGYANSASVTRTGLRLDTVLPTINRTATCATPGNAAPTGTWCRQAGLSMTATFGDAGSGLQAGTSQYNNDGAGWTNYTAAVSLAEDNGRVVQLRATDIAGNQGLTSVTYYIDGTAPALTLTAPLPPSYPSLTSLNNALAANCSARAACGTSSDATSGLASAASVQWRLVRGNNASCYRVAGGWGSCTGYAFQGAVGTLPGWTTPMASIYAGNNTYTGTIQSTDRAGNATVLSGSFSIS